MDGYDSQTYGELWAPYYDDVYPDVEPSVIDLLARHAGSPPRALELAIGTGRIALPLIERGVEVVGIDSSPAMVAKLRAKEGGQEADVIMGDFGEVNVDGTFPLIYLAFNTIFGLLTLDRQVACFANVADHLEPGGRFIIDAFVPDVKRYDQHNTRMAVSSISSPTEHVVEMGILDPVNQVITNHVIRRKTDGTEVVLPVMIRYAYPAELDLMARLAGLVLEDRFGWYDLRAFNAGSTSHMSIYRKPT